MTPYLFRRIFAGLRLLAVLLCAATLTSTAAAQTAEPDPGVEAASPGPLEALLEVLRDESARSALIAELETVMAVPVEEPEAPVSIGRRLAAVTQESAEATAKWLQSAWQSLGAAPDLIVGFGLDEIEVVIEALWSLLVVIAVTVGGFLLLRALAIPLYRRMGARAREAGVVRRTLIFLGSGAVDAVVVALAWASGYAVTVALIGEFGTIQLRQTLYLNAFLAVELVKAGFRLLISPATGDLRPLPLADHAARRLYRVLNVVISLVGYGYLLVVPIVREESGFAAGNSVGAVISVIAILYTVLAVLHYRRPVAGWLVAQMHPAAPLPEAMADEPTPESPPEATGAPAEEVGTEPGQADASAPPRRGVFTPLAQNWHWFALALLAWILFVVVSRPAEVVFEVLWASARIVVALTVGLLVSGFLGRQISRGIHLPPHVNERLPLLERRVNRFVPHALLLLRVVIVAIVVVFAFDTLGVLRARGWLESQLGVQVTAAIVSVVLILLVAFGIWLALTSWVDYRLNPDFGSIPTAREKTLLTLLRNAATIALLILTLMFALAELGLNIGPLLASAGVLGLAIGFGAQKMVQDIITGVFIQFENAINVGDVVSAGGITGAVERLTVRSVSLRDLEGIYHIIPFSSVDTVSNYTREFSFYVIDMGVAYRESVPEVKQAMFDAYEELRRDPEHGLEMLGDLEWFGLDAFGDSAVVLKCRIKTLPAKQWSVGRAYNEIVKRIFDERGIEIPFPHQTLYFGEDREGRAPPVRVLGVGGQ